MTTTTTTTASTTERKLCMIPGPVEFDEAVLDACGSAATSHVAPDFIKTFGKAIRNLRRVFLAADDSQPFVVAGSGTLGWDMVAANLIQTGDNALVLNTGYFGNGFGDCLETYGANVSHVRAPVGDRPSLDAIKEALSKQSYRLVTITHVDTSTGVLMNVKEVAQVVRAVSPNTLIVVDGVCSIAAEELRMAEWDVDVALTASQKAIGVPPGLCILVASGQAMRVFHERTSPVANYYASWSRWLPIMQAYEHEKGSYFATPPVQLIKALDVGLEQILAYGMDAVFAKHCEVNAMIKSKVASWGLKLVAKDVSIAANTLSAVYLPEGVAASDLLPKLGALGIVAAGGLHKEIGPKYFRIGHMGVVTIMQNDARGYVNKTLNALCQSLKQCGYACC